jgi:hypothetical protein
MPMTADGDKENRPQIGLCLVRIHQPTGLTEYYESVTITLPTFMQAKDLLKSKQMSCFCGLFTSCLIL